MKRIVTIIALFFALAPAVATAAVLSSDGAGMIDPGGIMTSKAAEERQVQEAIDQQRQQQQRMYWLNVAGLIVFSLGIFELGLQVGRGQKC